MTRAGAAALRTSGADVETATIATPSSTRSITGGRDSARVPVAVDVTALACPTVMDPDEVTQRARHLANVLEPFVGQVYFSPECHRAYAALGFGPSPGDADGVALPDGPAYFTSRGSAPGQAPGELVASTFAVFTPAVVVPAVTYGWSLTDAPTMAAARTDGAVGQLVRILGPEPDGLDRVNELLARACDALRP